MVSKDSTFLQNFSGPGGEFSGLALEKPKWDKGFWDDVLLRSAMRDKVEQLDAFLIANYSVDQYPKRCLYTREF